MKWSSCTMLPAAPHPTNMASSKIPSEGLMSAGEQRKALGDDCTRRTHAGKKVSSLLHLSAAAIAQAAHHSTTILVLALPFLHFDERHHCNESLAAELRRQLSLYFTSAAEPPQASPAGTSSPDSSAGDRRLLAEIRQELDEANGDDWQEEQRLARALAILHELHDTIREFVSQQSVERRSAEGVQRHCSVIAEGAPSEAASNPRQRASPTGPRPFVASNRRSTTSFRDELYEAGRQAIETRAYRARRQRLVDDLEKTVNSFVRCWEAVIASCRPAASPCSQAWMPQNLAMTVSRVCYYSSDYAEEIISAPLEVSGYTVRLAVLCLAEDSCVKLLFRAQFCLSSGNGALQWPFRGVVQFVIHHPRNPASNRVYSVHPSQDSETIMPTNTNNAFFYLAGPISAMNLDQRGYWAMETLHLSVKVVPGPNSVADS